MELTFLGHACFLAKIDNTEKKSDNISSKIKSKDVRSNSFNLIFDPYISSNQLAQSIDIDKLKVNYILASHGHVDHVEDIERIYKNQEKATLIATIEICNWFKGRGVTRSHPMTPGGKWNFEFGTVNIVQEAHSSSLPDGTYGGTPLGFVIEIKDKAFYFAGDTGLHQDMKLVGELFDIDFAILPIGGNFTMDIDQALIAAEYIKTEKIIGMHFDTFPMININHKLVMEKATKHKKQLILMNIGETKKM